MQRKLRRNGKTKHSERRTAISRDIANLTLKEVFLKFRMHKRAEGLAPRTLDDYEHHFGYLIDYLGKDLTRKEIKTDIFLEYVNYMQDERKFSAHTVNLRIRTLKTMMKWAYEEGFILEAIHTKLKVIKAPIDNVEPLEPFEIKQLLGAIDDSWFSGFRNKVIIMVLLDTLSRVGELLKVKRKDLDLKKGVISLEASNTKSKKFRVLPLSLKTQKLLNEYLQEVEDFDSEYLFLTYDGKPYQVNSFRTELLGYGRKAGIEDNVHPHKLRHTLNGGDAFSLQKLLGHSTLNTTRIYVQMANQDVQKQHENFSPLKNIF
ncbi:tyrosine-type recombinase/integrase [Sutcliffiella horikoshii]|uniref:tyrosine-type recombinase/integrase n=1 Tax=Sutcliffiella horikoshii TaxID=79883 RepID=UPI001EED2481|nr:tyrosine-type recombinase/integrase [Sutcliffiella horikoshii]MCG1020789.1 integrase [Sutcliffiella horikoshii]